MKKRLLSMVILLTILLFGCSDTDTNPSSSSGSSNSNELMNNDGHYDGAWRLIYQNEYGYNDFKFNEVPENNFFDIDSGTEMYSDTSLIISLIQDSATLYMFDPEENPDTFMLECLTLDELNEFETDDWDENDEESLGEALKSRFSLDSIGEINNFTVERIDDITASNDTLTITFGFHISADFIVFKNEEILTGSYAGEAAGIFKLKKYSGTLPPDSWPKDYVVDNGEEEEDDDEENTGDNGDKDDVVQSD